MTPLDLTFQATPVFWGMLSLLAASGIAIVALGVTGSLSLRRRLSSGDVIQLQPRAQAPTDSLRSAA